MTDTHAVLLVEDNPDDEALTLQSLERAKLASPIDVARDGQAALDYLFGGVERPAAPTPCLVLLDLKLPRVGGLDVLRRIRSEPRTRRTPVVILTSSGEQRDIVASYDHGANSYVTKPVQFDEFVHAVTQLGIYWLLINQRPPPQTT